MPTDIEAVAFDCFGTLIDFGQGDSVLLNGVSYEDIVSDPSRFISIV